MLRQIMKLLRRINRKRGFEFVSRAYVDPLYSATLPRRSTEDSGGYDFVLPYDIEIEPNKVVKIKSGIKAYMKKDEILKLFIRSSLGIELELEMPTSVSIIDSDFYNNPTNEGEITIVLRNRQLQTVKLSQGERVVQGVFEKYLKADNDKPRKKKRVGGIGSTN